MKMSELPLAPCDISVTGIESGEYFATDLHGCAVIFQCRAYVHGVLFDDREEPKPFKSSDCYAFINAEGLNILKLQHQCNVDRNKSIGVKSVQKNYELMKSEELVAKYVKPKRK